MALCSRWAHLLFEGSSWRGRAHPNCEQVSPMQRSRTWTSLLTVRKHSAEIKGPENQALNSIWVIPIEAGWSVRLATSGFLFGAFTSDGKGVLYLDQAGDLYRTNVDGTAKRKLAALGPGATDLRMSPDGRVVRVFLTGSRGSYLRMAKGLHKLLPNWRAPAPILLRALEPGRKPVLLLATH